MFNTILTKNGLAKIAAAAAAGKTVKLLTFAVGEADYIPTGDETELRSEKYRKPIDSASTDPKNETVIILNTIIPETIGGFYICEYGIFDDVGDLIAIGIANKVYKPKPGDVQSVSIKFATMITLSNLAAVEFNVQLDGYATNNFVVQQDNLVKDWVEKTAITSASKTITVQTGSSTELMTRIIYPTDAYYNSIYAAGAQKGAICITLPVSIKALNTMLKMTVNIYNNNSQTNTSSICISGCWGASTWNNVSATTISGFTSANYPISFGANSGGEPCIYIGAVASTWSTVMRVSVDNLLASYTAATIANLSTGWNIGIVTSITGLSTYSQDHIDDMIAAGHSELPTLGAPIVLNSNFTQAKGVYDIDAAGNVLTVINSTGGKFMSGITVQPDITYKRNSTFNKGMNIVQRLSSDLTYQEFSLSPVGSTATGGNGWVRLYKYDADGLNSTYKQLFSMNPDTGVVGFSYIPTAPTLATGAKTLEVANAIFVSNSITANGAGIIARGAGWAKSSNGDIAISSSIVLQGDNKTSGSGDVVFPLSFTQAGHPLVCTPVSSVGVTVGTSITTATGCTFFWKSLYAIPGAIKIYYKISGV